MLTSYEMPDLTTVIAHLRQDIYWQNIAPANGRQFVAADVVYHYDRMLGLGDGFTTVAPYYASSTIWHSLVSVTATDKFTVVWKWVPNTSPLLILTQMQLVVCDNSLECPEAVQQWGNLNDWHHAIGTGPYILTDFVDSSSVTYVKNPNFWYYDKRWPQDKLPYIDTIKTLIIANSMTAEAALRTGKIDYMGVSAIDARSIAKTNPEIVQKPLPANSETSVDPRNDLAPFNDIRVRTALQEAINIPLISSTYYLGTSTPWPSSLTENLMGIGGWGYPYPDWPQTLKDEYAYNPTNAKALLAAAGFPNGFTTTLVLESDADQDLFQIVRSEFADIGVNVNTQLMDVATWQSWVLNGRKQTALASRGGMIGVNSSPFSELARFTTGYQLNYICVSDPKIDAWYAQATTASDVNTVKQILHDENLYIAQQHIVISVAQPTSYNLVQPWVKGCAGPNALGQGPISGFVGSWGAGNWIDLDLKKSLGH